MRPEQSSPNVGSGIITKVNLVVCPAVITYVYNCAAATSYGMRITIVTINFNGSEETLKLLKSLENQTDKDFEILVVDNASEETDFSNLQTKTEVIHITTPHQSDPLGRHPPAGGGGGIGAGQASQVVYPQVVRNSKNLGFSGGNNVGINQALQNDSDWVILLNNDTWIEMDFIERLRGILTVKNGVVGIPLIEGDGVAYCGKIQWLKPTLIHITTPHQSDPLGRHPPAGGGGGIGAGQASQVVYPQGYAIGGAVAIHKDVFKKIGLLDEKYFLYFEDADFSARARKAGFDISIAENLSVRHHVSSSTKKLGSPMLLHYHYRNALYFNLKNGSWYIKLLVWPYSWLIVLKQAVKILARIHIEQSKAISAGVIDFYKNKYGKI